MCVCVCVILMFLSCNVNVGMTVWEMSAWMYADTSSVLSKQACTHYFCSNACRHITMYASLSEKHAFSIVALCNALGTCTI